MFSIDEILFQYCVFDGLSVYYVVTAS